MSNVKIRCKHCSAFTVVCRSKNGETYYPKGTGWVFLSRLSGICPACVLIPELGL